MISARFAAMKILTQKFKTWFFRAKPFGVLLVVLTLTFLLAGFLADGFCFNLTTVWGVLLELVGVWFVARQINERRKMFAKPSLQFSVWRWIFDFSKIFERPTPVTINASFHEANDTVFAHASTSFTSPALDVESRLAAVEKNLTLMQSSISHIRNDLFNRTNALEMQLRSANSTFRETVDKANSVIEKINVSGAEYDLVGVIFVAIGGIITNYDLNLQLSATCQILLAGK
jgi:hypothetical protein